MAQPDTLKYGDVVVQVATDDASTTFVSFCGVMKKDFKLTKSLKSQPSVDCADEDAAGWEINDADTKSAEIALSGLLDKAVYPELVDIFDSNVARTVKFRLVGAGSGGATPDAQASGTFHVTDLSVTGEKSGRGMFDITFRSDGSVAFTSVAALP